MSVVSETRTEPIALLRTFIVSAHGIAYVDKLSDSGMRRHAE
ncbi:hypothetical protein GGD63_000378 [Bradyrhizobium sp. cir1]|nr:hypothetical protein [Bradyrhizobium sp. cir1]